MLRISERPGVERHRNRTIRRSDGACILPSLPAVNRPGDTMNIRRSWITALAAAPLLALPLLPAAAASAAPLVHGSGQVTCPIKTGSGGLSPGLTPAGGTNVVKISFNGTFGNSCISAVTQPPGDQVTGGTFTGGGYYTGALADSCANFDGGEGVGRITVTMHLRTTGAPIQATTIMDKNNPG